MKRLGAWALALTVCCGCDEAATGNSGGPTGVVTAPATTVEPSKLTTAPTAAVASTARGIDDEEHESVDDEPDPPAEDSCASPDPGLKPLQLLRFTWTDKIANRDPAGKLHIARPGQRVYAHLRLRNRSGRKRCVHLTFRVGTKKRTEVTLAVGKSWSWRTWAYNTLRGDDRGPLHLIVADDQGRTIIDSKLPIVAK